MQLVFALSFLAMCVVVSGQTCSVEEFKEDPGWETSTNAKNPPRGRYPSARIQKALAADPKINKLYKERNSKKQLEGPKSFTAVSKWVCPYSVHYIWKINGCWVVKPRPLRYVQCRTRTCKHCAKFTGRCREDCYYKYQWVLVACKKGNNFYCKWVPGPRLPQWCDCRRC